MEVKSYPGMCLCKRKLEMRILSQENLWLLYGVCHPCEKIFAIGFISLDVKPIEGRDFLIDWNRMVKVTRPLKLKRQPNGNND